MKEYTFDEMVEKFGIGFTGSVMGIQEVFIGATPTYGSTTFYKTEQETKERVKQVWIDRYDNQVKNLNEIVEAYERLPLYKRVWSFLFKGAWKKNNLVAARMREFAVERERSLSSVDSKVVHYLSRENYKLHAPELDVGDHVYISVSSKNFLPVGVHKGEVTEVKYHLSHYDSNVLTCKAEVKLESGEELEISVQSEKGELSTGYTYHKVHLDKEGAVNRITQEIEKQQATLNEQMRAMERW